MMRQTMLVHGWVFSVFCGQNEGILNWVLVKVDEMHLVGIYFFLINASMDQESVAKQSWGMGSEAQW